MTNKLEYPTLKEVAELLNGGAQVVSVAEYVLNQSNPSIVDELRSNGIFMKVINFSKEESSLSVVYRSEKAPYEESILMELPQYAKSDVIVEFIEALRTKAKSLRQAMQIRDEVKLVGPYDFKLFITNETLEQDIMNESNDESIISVEVRLHSETNKVSVNTNLRIADINSIDDADRYNVGKFLDVVQRIVGNI